MYNNKLIVDAMFVEFIVHFITLDLATLIFKIILCYILVTVEIVRKRRQDMLQNTKILYLG